MLPPFQSLRHKQLRERQVDGALLRFEPNESTGEFKDRARRITLFWGPDADSVEDRKRRSDQVGDMRAELLETCFRVPGDDRHSPRLV